MSESVLEQARLLHKTIKQLQTRVLLKNAPKDLGLPDAPKELTLPQLSTLLAIRDRRELSLKDVAEATGVSAPSASVMVDRLVDLGVLTREAGRQDRRAVRLALSKEGERVVETLEEQLLRALVDLIEQVGPELARQWCEVYARIQEIIDEEEREGKVPGTRTSQGRQAV